MKTIVKKDWVRPVVYSIEIKSNTTRAQSKGAYETFSNLNNPGPLSDPKGSS